MRIRLNNIFENNPVTDQTLLPESAQDQGRYLRFDDVVDRWAYLSQRVCLEDQEAARAVIVQRARRIWGRLGCLLKKFRTDHFVPEYAMRLVKRWRQVRGFRPRR